MPARILTLNAYTCPGCGKRILLSQRTDATGLVFHEADPCPEFLRVLKESDEQDEAERAAGVNTSQVGEA